MYVSNMEGMLFTDPQVPPPEIRILEWDPMSSISIQYSGDCDTSTLWKVLANVMTGFSLTLSVQNLVYHAVTVVVWTRMASDVWISGPH